MKKTPKLLTVLGLAIVLVLTLAVDADAGKKKRKKKNKKRKAAQTEAVADSSPRPAALPTAALGSEFSKVLGKADNFLLAYETSQAAAALASVENERDPAVLVARARVFEQSKEYDRAVGVLEEAAALAPTSPEPLIHLGETLLHSDRMGAAADAFARAEARARQVLDANPDDVAALYFLGVAQQRQHRFVDAAETLLMVRSKEPRNAKAAYQLGATLAFGEDWNGAIATLDDAIALDSGIAYAYYYRGLAAGKLDRKDLLVNDLDRFLAMAPEAPEAPRARKILAAAK